MLLSRSALAATALSCALAAPAAAAPTAVFDTCPPEAEGARCGHVDVPFDRADPSAGTIAIAFEQYLHTDPGAAESAIIINFGGPGVSTIALRDLARGWREVRDRFDLLLIDSRGTGRSGLVNCPDYQSGNGPSLIALGATCARQLGASAVRYSSADIAKDYDAVRAALGYELVDFAGTSYGGVNANAYASRFGRHLRSVVLDGGVEPAMDPFARGYVGVQKMLDRLRAICARSRNCGRSPREAAGAVGRVLDRLRRAPLRGTALDAHGGSHELDLAPGDLLVHVVDNVEGFGLTQGEFPAAADALERGDAKPLLRLAAEGDFPIPGDSGDVNFYSQAANSATYCLDNPWPWAASAPLALRKLQWAAAVAATPDAPFAPFRAEEVMFSLYGMSDFCLPWPGTGTQLAVEPGARFTKAPTLILDGEFDANVGRAEVVAARFPNATLVHFEGLNHTPGGWSQCARDLRDRFLRTLTIGDATCADSATFDNPAVTAFPRRASESPAATAGPGNRGDLRLARVAADATIDAFKRGILNRFSGGDGTAPGLRGGSVHADGDEHWTATLDGIRWTDDVAVSGTLRWSFDGGPFEADLRVDGPGRNDGTLHLAGGFLIHGAPRSIAITGTLTGRRVVASVPSN
ncbi:alpha/beta hydrolase [Solirubrobacter ginsenosidimutans]|uniref:Alpha/beta hydrolase n=1 Tax=Solirubrobacter ginsenosidimutans TaxID=490573 RepID=A0A9X3MT63_9ACTN|nr:alpha/beta fold hydrolase [Solirubrobacter ginsenosidimutans]MDA0160760.1 alpha/beta hydrolase [Solirubrobacter ginsenosidimutans]